MDFIKKLTWVIHSWPIQYRGKFQFLPFSAKLYALSDFWSSDIHILPKAPIFGISDKILIISKILVQ